MRFMETGIVGAWLIDPTPHEDNRGRFLRTWCANEFSDHGVDFVPVQANMAFSITKGTVRGMHLQVAPAIEAKLVRCTRGPSSTWFSISGPDRRRTASGTARS